MNKIYTFANMFDRIKSENYNLWNREKLNR